MPRIRASLLLPCLAAMVAGAPFAAFAQADFSSARTQLQSINSGAVSATGRFTAGPDGAPAIDSGEANTMTVTAQGAMVGISVVDMRSAPPGGTAPGASALVSIDQVDARAENSGTITADGTFSGMRVSNNSRRSGMSVQAVGAGVSISATNSSSSR